MTTTAERPQQTTDSDRAALYDALAAALREGNVRSGDWHKVAEQYAKPHFSDGDQLDAARVDAATKALLASEAVGKRGPGYLTLGPAPAGATAAPDSVPAPGPRVRIRKPRTAAAPAADVLTSTAPPAKKAAGGRTRAKATAAKRTSAKATAAKRTPAKATAAKAAETVPDAPAAEQTPVLVEVEPTPAPAPAVASAAAPVEVAADTGGDQPATVPVEAEAATPPADGATAAIPAQRRQPLAEAFTAFSQQLTTELAELSAMAHQIDDLVEEYTRRSSALRELADVVTEPKLAVWIADLQPDMPKVVAAHS